MTAEFDWWLLIVGLVVGAGLVWLILAEWPRRDAEIEDAEVPIEAAWIAAQLGSTGRPVHAATVEAILREHRAYLRLPPPDEELATPVAPAAPVAPVAPAAPAAFTAPGVPTAPLAPAAPASPAAFTAPGVPTAPLAPAEPGPPEPRPTVPADSDAGGAPSA